MRENQGGVTGNSPLSCIRASWIARARIYGKQFAADFPITTSTHQFISQKNTQGRDKKIRTGTRTRHSQTYRRVRFLWWLSASHRIRFASHCLAYGWIIGIGSTVEQNLRREEKKKETMQAPPVKRSNARSKFKMISTGKSPAKCNPSKEGPANTPKTTVPNYPATYSMVMLLKALSLFCDVQDGAAAPDRPGRRHVSATTKPCLSPPITTKETHFEGS